jgi:hypothetical protein
MSSQYPLNVQVVPDKLSVQIHRHEVPYFEPVPCWTVISDGLWAHRQKEVVITLKRDPQDDHGGPPKFAQHIIQNIYNLAVQGSVVDTWRYSNFVVTVPKKGKGLVFNTAYLYPLPLSGIQLPKQALTVTFLNPDDFKVFQAFGLSRLVATRGNHYRYYPCPPWSEFPAPKIVSLEKMKGSILGKMARMHLQGSTVAKEGENIVLRLQPQGRQLLEKQLAQFKPEQPVALLPELDPNANACLFWVPEKNTTGVNVPPRSDRSRTSGCFVAFIPAQAQDSARVFEDGFALLATTEAWKQIREAMLSGKPITVPSKGQIKRFRLEHVPSA